MTAPAGLSRWSTALLAALLVALAAAGAVFGPREAGDRPPYALDSAQDDGLLALARWLKALGYDVGRLGAAPPAADDRLVFVWPGQRPFEDDAVAALLGWVRGGGTLALVGPGWNERALGAALGVRQADAGRGALRLGSAGGLSARQPLVPDGPVDFGAPDGPALDLSGAPAAVAVVAGAAGPTVAVQALGRGRVWHFSPRHDFTNARLRDDVGDAALLAPLLRHVPAGGRVRFDAYHLATPAAGAAAGVGTLRGWLWGSGPGRALLWLAALGFAALVLAGRRLGPPLPPAQADARRTEAEFVTAVAGLHRRAGDRAVVVDHLRGRLARAVRRGGLDAAAAERLAAIDAGLAAAREPAALLRWAAAAEAALDGLGDRVDGNVPGNGGRG